MPNLVEYIRTLKNYNPGITDKAVTIYLMKDGWHIDEIENAFKEVNGVIAPSELNKNIGPNNAGQNLPQSASANQSTKQIEVQPTEIKNTAANYKDPFATSNTISYPSFEQVKQKVQTVDTVQTQPQAQIPPKFQPQIQSQPPIQQPQAPSQVAPKQNIPLQDILHDQIEKVQAGIPPVGFSNSTISPNLSVSNNNTPVSAPSTTPVFTQSATPTQTPPNVSSVIPSSSQPLAQNGVSVSINNGFGAPVESRRPNFSYNTIMGGDSVNNPNSSSVSTSSAMVPTPSYVGNESIKPQSKEYVVNVKGEIRKEDIAQDLTNIPKISFSNQTAVSQEFGSLKENTPTLNDLAGGADMSTMTKEQAEAYARIMAGKKPDIPRAYDPLTDLNNKNNSAGAKPLSTAETLAQASKQYQSVPVSQSPSTISPEPRKVKQPRSKLLQVVVWMITLTIVLGGSGFAYMKYVHGIYVFVNEPFAKEDFLKGFVKSLATVNKADYTASIELKVKDKEPNLELLEIGDDEYTSGYSIASFIPTDAVFTASINGNYSREKNQNDGKFGIKASYAGDGISVDLDLESIKNGENYYVRINTLPSFFFDVSKITDKWILITEDDMNGRYSFLSSIAGFSTEEGNLSSGEASATDMKEQYIAALELANNKGVIQVVGDPVKKVDSSNNRVVYEYEIKINYDNLVSFVEELPKYGKEKFGDKSIFRENKSTLDDLKSEKLKYYFDYINKNSKMIVGIDTKGYFAYLDTYSKVAPSGLKQEKQIDTSFRVGLDKINQNSENYVPTNPMLFIDAYSIISNKSKEQILYETQVDKIEGVKSSIDRYIKYTGQSPVILEDLNRSTAELAAASTTFMKGMSAEEYLWMKYSFSTSTAPLYKGNFKDTVTGDRIKYEKVGNSDFKLEYEIKLPPMTPEKFKEAGYYSFYNPRCGTDPSQYYSSSGVQLCLKFVEGKNTANSKYTSIEAIDIANIDKDKDKVSDSLEKYVGTDINKADTDGDGDSDYDEIRYRGNPFDAKQGI